ncbi:transferase family-domain-containing protein [Aspergillus bertholletiae]|uniref:Transferase family-domain-containing protein n=1 Tax=Aspergillus bertholletiae TaxID=1226010 RepID=A0A5N7B952_9EURO|nr:transferase family-domain-containing protein [Aspergillus bertholletiae]
MAEPTCVEQLAPLDLSMPSTYIRVLLVFEQAGSALQIIQSLQSGLDKLSSQLPWLSGRVFQKASTQDRASVLEIRWNASQTLTLVDKGTIAAPYKPASSHGIPSEAIPSDVWPAPGMIDGALLEMGAPVFAASIFRFADEGVGLCVCLHHNAVDGTGLSEIIRLWARNVVDPRFTFTSSPLSRSERLSATLSLDLQAASSTSSDNLFMLHPEYSRIPPTMPEEFPSCTSKLFMISMHWIDTLKELMCNDMSKAPSTNTVLCALIWATITRVRMQHNPSLGDGISRLGMAVNGRHRIGENFSGPESPFLGNAVVYSLSKFPAGALAASDETPVRSLAKICEHIAQSQSRSVINSRYIAEVYHLIDRMEDCRSLFVGWDLFGSRDLTITNWADLGLYEMDFGDLLGRPKFVRLPYMEADGVALILPRQRSASQEVLEVMIMLRRDHMDALEKDPMWQALLSRRSGDGGGVRPNVGDQKKEKF